MTWQDIPLTVPLLVSAVVVLLFSVFTRLPIGTPVGRTLLQLDESRSAESAFDRSMVEDRPEIVAVMSGGAARKMVVVQQAGIRFDTHFPGLRYSEMRTLL